MASAGLAGGTAFPPETLQAFFKGIQKYQGHAFKRIMPELPSVWQAGEARLLSAQQNTPIYNVPVVLVPSMVNGSEILDLLPDRSLLRWLAAQGFDSYLLDWGRPVDDVGQADIDTVMAERLIPAIESLGTPVLLLGYCMGGLFSAALASLRPDLVKGVLLLASPWNFHDEKGALKARLQLMKPMATPYIKQYHRLPESWMQAVFATLDPEGSIKKFASFANMNDGDPREEIFVAVEDWLNEGLDLPAGIAAMCMDDWYENNLTYKNEWVVAGQPIVAKNIKVPTFVIAAKEDRIVPLDSALAFADQRIKGDRLVCASGHVGLLSGRNAVVDIWKPIADWFAAQQ
jgi:polyhydroxyalkanoate synthase subunit PhaC